MTVKGVAGQAASLPCYIDEANCGDIYFLTWSKLDRDEKWSRIWVYSDDNVNKPLSNLAGRAQFSKESSKAQLLINSLTPSDESLYKVGVPFLLLLSGRPLNFCCCFFIIFVSLFFINFISILVPRRFIFLAHSLFK